MKRFKSKPDRTSRRRGFTLIELMIVITIIAILAGLTAVVMSGAATDAKIAKTESQIQRINLLLLERWESYETRPLQIATSPGANILAIQRDRVWAMRELMRAEMPDRFSDFMDFSASPATFRRLQYTPLPSVQRRYIRTFINIKGTTGPDPNEQNESAECLYLILASIEDDFGNGLENFRPSEIGDTDGDGLNEILDAWGKPIQFVRWPAGYQSNVQQVVLSDAIAYAAMPAGAAKDARLIVLEAKFVHDPLDVFQRDVRPGAVLPATPPPYAFEPYMTYPLIFSAGPNQDYDGVNVELDVSASNTDIYWNTPDFADTNGVAGANVLPYPFDDPYIYDARDTIVRQLGSILNTQELGTNANLTSTDPVDYKFGTLDNIDNHFGIQQ